MIPQNFLRRWFEEQLSFRLRDGTQEQSVWIGSSEFSPVGILGGDCTAYNQEFNTWLYEDWKPRQQELREELLSYSANSDRYLDLQRAAIRQQVIPLVGSGMSVPSGLPTWAEFLMKVSKFTQCSLSELEKLLSSSCFEEAADLLADSTNPRLFTERLDHDLRIDGPETINGPVCLLPGLFSNLVITTNLDQVLECLYESCGVPFEDMLWGDRLAEYRHLKGPNARLLLKLHGDCQNERGRVLLSCEYEAAYAPNSPSREELSLLCRNNSLLFLGCSLGPDRTVHLLEDVATDDTNMLRHYALLAKPQDENEKITREHFLTERGIFPIWYDLPHDEAIMALLDGLNIDETT